MRLISTQNPYIRIALAILLACAVVSGAYAAAKPPSHRHQFKTDNSWFAPRLLVNHDPAICTPLLSEYKRAFERQWVDPLVGDIAGIRGTPPTTGIADGQIQEVIWSDLSGPGENPSSHYRIAEFRVGNRTYSIVRHHYSIGWREGFSEDTLIDKPQDSIATSASALAAYFKEYPLGRFAKNASSDSLRITTPTESTHGDYRSFIYGHLVNIYSAAANIYLLFKIDNGYTLLRFVDERQLPLTCEIQTTPRPEGLRQLLETMPRLEALNRTLFEMMGTPCNEGTLGAQSRAANQLRSVFELMLYRPWVLRGREASRAKIEANFVQWGYSGVAQYSTYRNFLHHLPLAESELAQFYARNYSVSASDAETLAASALAAALVDGFDHGRMTDPLHELHKKILTGQFSREDLPMLANSFGPEDSAENETSLLTFAVLQPRVLKLLLEHGVSPNQINWFGKTPLMYAAQYDQLESARRLLKHGAHINAHTLRAPWSCMEVSHLTALHYALRYSSFELIKLLLQHQAPTYIADTKGRLPKEYLVEFNNPRLTENHRNELQKSLEPPDENRRRDLAHKENRLAEKLYARNQLSDSYATLRRALQLDPKNESALANLSLVALRLGELGESAQASRSLIDSAVSPTARASASFNMGLACLKSANGRIEYDGINYCEDESSNYSRTSAQRMDTGAMAMFLAAYRLKPNKQRLTAILDMFGDDIPGVSDIAQNRKYLSVCRFGDNVPGLHALYVHGHHWYFLTDTNKPLSLSVMNGIFGDKESPIPVVSKVIHPLNDEISIEEWKTQQGYYMPTRLDNVMCAPSSPSAYAAAAKVIAIYPADAIKRQYERSAPFERSPTTVRLDNSMPIILVLYGRNLQFRLEGNVTQARAIIVYGNSHLDLPSGMQVPVLRMSDDYSLTSLSDAPNQLQIQLHRLTGLTVSRLIKIPSDRDESIVLSDESIEQLHR